MPFGKWSDYASCVSDMMKKYSDKPNFKKENAEKICGALKHKLEK